jgi:hypothetical protein
MWGSFVFVLQPAAVLFRVSLHQRVFSLNCGQWLNRTRPADCFGTRLREPEVQNFSCFHQIFNGTGYVFDWHVWIDPMLVIEIRCGRF